MSELTKLEDKAATDAGSMILMIICFFGMLDHLDDPSATGIVWQVIFTAMVVSALMAARHAGGLVRNCLQHRRELLTQPSSKTSPTSK